MIEKQVNLPTLGLIAGTRVLLGVGIGLLLANRLMTEERHSLGWTLLGIGAITTIPLAMEMLGAKGSHPAAVN